MPYSAVSDLPDNVKSLPAHAQEIYMKAFNSAFKQYDGDEGKSHGTAWGAVKKSYKKVGGKWVAKESDKRRESMKLSDENKKNLLQTALVAEYGLAVETPRPKDLTIEEVIDNEIIYNVDGQLYQSTFEIGEDGAATFGNPTKVTSTKIFKAVESLSMENRRAILDSALQDHLNIGKDEYAYIEDMTETELIYRHANQTYKAPYSIAEDMTVTIGDSVEVTRQVIYKPMEALQLVYADIIQEAGRRNANLDSTRIKRIVALCQELLSSEADPEEKKIGEALKEANAVLAQIKEQATMKTEDGVKFPASAYAYVPDADKSSTWKLRMWEDLESKVTRAQLGMAAAALSPAGFRGEKVQIPATDLASVKRKIRAEYRKLDVEDDDIPRAVREAWSDISGKGTVWSGSDEKRELIQDYVSLAEAKYEKGRATLDVIKAGFNSDQSRYYPVEMLKRDYKVFEGMKMYADHPTEEEDKARPERSIRDWVATLSEVVCDENGLVTGIAEIIEPWMMQKLAALRDKKMLSEMGVSINAVGTASKGTVEGKETLVVEKLVAARSVDFVTEPGAGGVVTFYESDRTRDIDLVELSTLKERRPELVKAIEADIRAEIIKEAKYKMGLEDRITELETENQTLTTKNTELQDTITEGEKAKAKADAQATIKEAVEAAELPDASKAVLIKRFAEAETADGIEEAIQEEKDYIAQLSEAGKVKGMGPASKSTPEKDRESLKESFKKSYIADGKTEEEAEKLAETAVTGR